MDVDAFVRDGYVAVRGAVDADTVAACQELIWTAMERRGVRRDDPGSWPPLVEGMDDLEGEPLLAAYTAPALTAAYDELIGPGRWEHAAQVLADLHTSHGAALRPAIACAWSTGRTFSQPAAAGTLPVSPGQVHGVPEQGRRMLIVERVPAVVVRTGPPGRPAAL